MHSTTVCGSNGVTSIVAKRTREGDRLILGCGDGLITVLEGTRNGAQTCRTYDKGPADRCAVMLDGKVSALCVHNVDETNGEVRILAGTEHGTLYAVQLSVPDYRAAAAPPAQTRVLQQSHYDKVIAVAYPRDTSETFATASADGTIRIWDVNTYSVTCEGKCQVSVTGEPLCLDFTGEAIFSGWEDGRIRAHEAEEAEELWSIDNCHRGGVYACVASNNRKFLVSGGFEGEVRVWEIRTREMVVNLKQHTMSVTSLKLLPDDSGVYSASRDRTILLWDLRSETREKYMIQRMGGINCIDLIAPDSDKLVSVGQEKHLTTWLADESNPISMGALGNSPPMGEQMCVTSTLAPGLPNSLQYTLIATGGAGDCRVRLWRFGPGNSLTPQVIALGEGHSSTIRSIKFAPDGKQLVSVGEDGACLVWNLFVEEIFPECFANAPA